MPSQVKIVSETSSIFIGVSSVASSPLPTRGWGEGSFSLQTPMRAVAARLVVGLLATAERDRRRFLGLELDRAETAALVGSVAEWLGAALAAGAPPIGLAGLHFDLEWAFLGADRLNIGHHRLLVVSVGPELRPGGVQCLLQPRGKLIDLRLGDDQRRREGDAIADEAGDQPIGAGVFVGDGARPARRGERRARRLVGHHLDTGQQ